MASDIPAGSACTVYGGVITVMDLFCDTCEFLTPGSGEEDSDAYASDKCAEGEGESVVLNIVVFALFLLILGDHPWIAPEVGMRDHCFLFNRMHSTLLWGIGGRDANRNLVR